MAELKSMRNMILSMDTTSLYYFLELSEDLHMTRTAEKLYVSQQTLSNHISRLEKELGCQLFYRKPSLSLTYAGEQVRKFADQMIREQINLQDILADVENQERGSIRFGASTLRMNACLPYILPKFSAEFPHVELQITDHNSLKLEPMIRDGELDYALVADYKNTKKGSDLHFRKDLASELLIRDPIYMCVTDEILQSYFGPEAAGIIESSREGTDLKPFSSIPFMLYQNRMGGLIAKCFEDAGYEPHTYIRAPYIQVITRIGMQGTAAFFSTGFVLSSQPDGLPDNLHVFPLLYKGQLLHQEIYLLWNKERYIPRYAARFLELLRECFRDYEHHPVISPDTQS